MKKIVDLPIIPPIYSTYHYQGPGTAITAKNPSIRNWYLNEIMLLSCNRKFLSGFTTPEISIYNSEWFNNKYFLKKWFTMEYLNGYSNYVIKNLLNDGYYICYSGVDDYYVEGKSWYKQRHFDHDGCICGYNENDKTYCLYAYDYNWVYKKFWTSQKSFNLGRKSMFNQGVYGEFCGFKVSDLVVDFNSSVSLKSIAEYLDSDINKYPEDGQGEVYGIVVHKYIYKYLSKLIDKSIPYERMDTRIFRLIWEHKKAMLERISLIESELQIGNYFSENYKIAVDIANQIRMMYAMHRVKRKDFLLPVIQEKLLEIDDIETKVLYELIDKTKGLII